MKNGISKQKTGFQKTTERRTSLRATVLLRLCFRLLCFLSASSGRFALWWGTGKWNSNSNSNSISANSLPLFAQSRVFASWCKSVVEDCVEGPWKGEQSDEKGTRWHKESASLSAFFHSNDAFRPSGNKVPKEKVETVLISAMFVQLSIFQCLSLSSKHKRASQIKFGPFWRVEQ